VDPEVTALAPTTTYRRVARTIGVLNTLAGLALVLFTARGLTDLAHQHVDAGLRLLVTVVIVRWFVVLASDEWSDFAARRIRDYWRSQLLRHFERLRGEGDASRADLSLAIDRASDEPGLALIEASAKASGLGLAVIFWAAGWLSTVITVALVLLAIPFYRSAGERSRVLTSEFYRRRNLLESRQLELLRHAPELRALGAIDYGAGEITAISVSEHRVAMRAIRVALESSLITEFLSGVSIGLVAMVVGFSLLGGRISLDHALVAVLATSELFLRVRRFGSEFHRQEDSAAALRLLSEPGVARTSQSDALLVTSDLISGASDGAVNLLVVPGTRVLVTGPSGSGKTTLLHTVLGWRSPRSGAVARSAGAVGFVSVDSELFAGSIWDNLTLGADVEPTTIVHQLTALGLEGTRFIDPNTQLLADGRGLSAGERVRLVLARCLLAAPGLLILDDIAGVLDQSSREHVVRALAEHPHLAIIEATVDTPLLHGVTDLIELGS
jgi:ABC-type transport system involved in cytochrome bd biosynthesis fused ATPase/permease subunit